MTQSITQYANDFTRLHYLREAYQGELQIFDLKQLADMEGNYKKQCIQALKTYKSWRFAHQQQIDMVAMLYGNLEGVMLRRHAENMVQAYWVIRRDFRRGFDDYLARHSCYPSQNIIQKSA